MNVNMLELCLKLLGFFGHKRDCLLIAAPKSRSDFWVKSNMLEESIPPLHLTPGKRQSNKLSLSSRFCDTALNCCFPVNRHAVALENKPLRTPPSFWFISKRHIRSTKEVWFSFDRDVMLYYLSGCSDCPVSFPNKISPRMYCCLQMQFAWIVEMASEN
jgi:hypothetical protein